MRTDIIQLAKNESIEEIDTLLKAIYFSPDIKHLYFKGEYTANMLGDCLKNLSNYEIGDVIELNSTRYIVLGYYSGYLILLTKENYNKPIDKVSYVLKEVHEPVLEKVDIGVYLLKQRLLRNSNWIDKLETKEQSDKHIDNLVAYIEEHNYLNSKVDNQLKFLIILLTIWYLVPILVILGICQLFQLHSFCTLSTLFSAIISVYLCLFRDKFYNMVDKVYALYLKRVEKRYFHKEKRKLCKT